MINKKQFIGILKMGRFFVLIAGLIAYTLGLSMAYHDIGYLNLPKAIIGLFIMTSATLTAHYVNEYADVDTDTITRRTWFSGGSGVLPSKIVPRSWALNVAVILAGFTIILTALSFYFKILTIAGVLIALIGLLGGWFYSMPPLQLERTYWGEIDNAILGGFFMPIIGYITQVDGFGLKEVIILTPIIFAVLVNLLAVHWSDRKADEVVGKNTMVVKLGKNTKTVHAVFTGLIYVILALLVFLVPLNVIIVTFLTIPIALWSIVNFEKSPMSSSFLMGSVMIFASIGFIIS
ncbi:prenyltransferase [Methanobacterium sp. ACI-7]|uniref:prenyltransferase n=1 Tax=unclassified Methanobacterium TaxID=2627676 RepID=UPI0039C492D2